MAELEPATFLEVEVHNLQTGDVTRKLAMPLLQPGLEHSVRLDALTELRIHWPMIDPDKPRT